LSGNPTAVACSIGPVSPVSPIGPVSHLYITFGPSETI
jgi:hypothetical protein